ncbi:Ubiquinone biosynthesis protein coq9, mitochondrial [Ciborinia camelliae]|nr:Ubiquinone biosynthesis protein coq9, mitochondrial [Ciborinia camelliae]
MTYPTIRLLPRHLRHLTQQHNHVISVSLSAKSYHSYDRPSPSDSPFPPTETSILRASLPHIPTHGFTLNTLSLGAQDVGYIPAATNLFPRGAFSLAHYHLYTQRLALKNNTELIAPLPETEGGEPAKGVGKRVKALTWERLMGNRDVIHKWQEAQALLTLPTNLPTSLRELHSLSDEIWFLSGDISVDSSWYTKRASLSTIYAATELFMTTDKSEGFKDTREFLERRFGDSQALGRMVGGIGQWVGFTAMAGVNVLRSKGVRI